MDDLMKRVGSANSNDSSRLNSMNSTLEMDEDDQPSFRKVCDDPSKMTPYVMKYSGWKWLVLFLGSMITFGDWYCMDNVAVLEQQLYSIKGTTYQQYSQLYTFYYAPNILMPLFVGAFIDKFGMRPSMIILSFIVMTGQLIFCVAAEKIHSDASFHIMVIGRAVYGFGMVSMIFTQVAFITDWFVGPHLNFALSITSSLPYSGAILDAYFSPLFFNHVNPNPDDTIAMKKAGKFGMSFWSGLIFNCTGLAIVLIVVFIDSRAEKNLEKMKKAWIRISADKGATDVVILEKPKFSIHDLKDFGMVFWLNCVSCCLQKIATFGYMMWIPIHYYKRYYYSHPTAAFLISVPYIIMVFTAPILGLIIDKIGKMMFFTNISCLLLCLAHLILFNLDGVSRKAPDDGDCNQCWQSTIPLVLIGINMTIFNINSNGSIISALIIEKARGSAYGINYAVQNLFLTFIPSFVAYHYDTGKQGRGEHFIEGFFLIVSCCAFTVNIVMWLYDMCFMNSMLQQKDPFQFKLELERNRKENAKEHALNRKLKMQKFDVFGLFTDQKK